ncbi:NOL1/NOP2/sun family [Novymonas esmeraldas]|uniref:NOL1/NOP2/Sun domain family member 4 n=1 Tax=Novymonas esmeraldas TaxID=1808958 RepID=A0AAW0EX56_9TRYP
MPPRQSRSGGRGYDKTGTVPTAHTKGGYKPKSSSAKPRTLDEYYSDVYGERWPALRSAMMVPPRKVALWNRFCQIPFAEATRGLVRVDPNSLMQAFQPSTDADAAAAVVEAERRSGDDANDAPPPPHQHHGDLIDKPAIDAFGVKAYYLLDYASTHIVEQLQVGAFDTVLDMCAAPGGKSVAIAQSLSPDGALTCNETRPDRCARLRRTLQEHIPVNYVPWRTTQRDAQTWYDPAAYSRVLVDAPCSSERHLLLQSGGTPPPLREWSEETTVQLAALQRALLQRAIETCRVGGRIVYSTCSISPMENDGVVAEVLQRTRCAVRVVSATPAAASAPSAAAGSEAVDTHASAPYTPSVLGEATAHGRLLLPDTCNGWGPMYFCVLEKVAEHQSMGSSSTDDDSGEDQDS